MFKAKDNENRELLSKEMAKQFHQTTYKLLFIYKQAMLDAKTLNSFLTTRVKQPDKDHWGKLRHGLMYRRGTLYMKRYMSADKLPSIVCWLDWSFGVH